MYAQLNGRQIQSLGATIQEARWLLVLRQDQETTSKPSDKALDSGGVRLEF